MWTTWLFGHARAERDERGREIDCSRAASTSAGHADVAHRAPCARTHRLHKANRRAELGLADARRVLQHGLEHRLQLARRTGDDAQHLGGRGLLLELADSALAQLVEQPRVLDGDDGLAAKFLTSSICLSVNGRTSWR